MPKYSVQLTATIEVEAENVVQAKKAAEQVKVIGQCVGGSYLKNNRIPIYRKISIGNVTKSNPEQMSNG